MALSAACAVAMGYNGFFSRTSFPFVTEDNSACYRLQENECGNNNAWGYVVGPAVEGNERKVEFYVQLSKAPSSLPTALFESTKPAAFQVLSTKFDDTTRVVTATIIAYQCTGVPILHDLGVPPESGFEQVGTNVSSNVDKEYGLILVVVIFSACVLMLVVCVVTHPTKIRLPRWLPKSAS